MGNERLKHALNEARKRVPVKLSINEIHGLLKKLALDGVSDEDAPGIGKWLDEKLSGEYGKAIIAALIASPLGVTLWASLIGKSGATAESIANEFAAASLEIGGVELGGNLLRLIPGGIISAIENLFKRFEPTNDLSGLTNNGLSLNGHLDKSVFEVGEKETVGKEK